MKTRVPDRLFVNLMKPKNYVSQITFDEHKSYPARTEYNEGDIIFVPVSKIVLAKKAMLEMKDSPERAKEIYDNAIKQLA